MEKLSILLINYNRLEYLRGTVESIYAQTTIPYELLIWDNVSTEEGIKEYLQELNSNPNNHTKVLFSPKNIGVWRASNELISRINNVCDLGFIKIDNDCIIKTKGWAQKWVTCCQQVPEIGMIGANIEGKKERSADTEVLELKGHKLFALKHEGTGGAVYVPGRTFKKLGFYNEEYGLYGHADKDYAKRVMLLGQEFAYHRDVEIGRFAVNNDDQTGGYRDHKNLYVRRNRRLYVLNRHLYAQRLRSLGIWYKKYADIVPKWVFEESTFHWADTSSKVHWDTGKVASAVRELLTKHKLNKIKK